MPVRTPVSKQVQGMCLRQYSGGAVITNKDYEAEGDFEFKIKPSFIPGVVTAVGLSRDTEDPSDQYLELIFDPAMYSTSQFLINMGGMKEYFGTGLRSKFYTINLSDVFPPSETPAPS
jgi:hypothetical protein